MRTDTHRQFDWSGRMEQLEDRLVMSADPLGGLLGGQIQHHAIVDEAPPIEHHAIAEQPPALEHHLVGTEPDFWIDSVNQRALEDEFERIEQSLANAHDQSGLTQVRQNYGFDGTGQTVAIIDSGIAYDHFALGGGFGSNYRVVGGYDFTGENDANPYDDGPSGSHGTHVSGIVGASGGTHTGVAPGVDLVGLRVFDDAGAGFFSWVENALSWVHTNRNSFENPITAVNLSLGVASWNSDAIPNWANLEDEFAQLEADGIFISVSAGNSFNAGDQGDADNNGTDFGAPGLSYPAASQYVIPVASVDDSGLLSYFSQRNSRVIAAPGRGIISTVPDYAGNNNGTTDDYASFSGTSMAAPYVAGASVIIREAMEFAGYTNITQDTIYNHMISTADSVFDSVTNQSYNRLNLGAAIDALMPTDDFGSTVATAHNLGSLGSSTSMSGAITTLNDVDYFKFTAASTGTATFTVSNTTHSVAANWDVNGNTGTWGANNESLTIDVVAGQEYTLGFLSADGLGYYDLDITTESTFSFTDWGSISFTQLQGVSVTDEGWYRVEANAAGYFTTEAMFNAGGGQVSLELYNSEMQLIDSGNAVGGVSRVDAYAAAGEELFLKATGTNSDINFRLTNLVSLDGTTVNVAGTADNDVFAFTAGNTHQVSVNGVSYDFAAIAVSDIQFDGSAGADSITLTGSDADETAFLRVGQTQLSSSSYAVEANQIETVIVDAGGGNDRAYLFDSAGSDTLIADAQSAHITGSGFDHLARGFDRTYSYATAGATDRIYLKDSTGNDSFVGRPDYARMSGAGFYNYSQGFELVYAFSSAGGNDTAYLYDSAGNDSLVATPGYARLSGAGFYNYTQGFDAVNAYATAGGFDNAYLYDSAGNDIFTARPEYGRLAGTGFNNYANGFDRVNAYATAGGNDLAYMYDSTGDDIFTARPEYGRMAGSGFYNQANGFDQVNAYAFGGGNDLAYMYDSAGDDVFVARPDYGRLSGDGFSNYAKAFDRVNAYATGGGNDRAYFYDSAGDDDFVARPDYGRMSGDDFNHYAKSFERVYAYATAGGNDSATLYGSAAGTDNFVSGPTALLLSGDNFYNYVSRFESLEALTHDGNPLLNTSAVDSVFDEAGV